MVVSYGFFTAEIAEHAEKSSNLRALLFYVAIRLAFGIIITIPSHLVLKIIRLAGIYVHSALSLEDAGVCDE